MSNGIYNPRDYGAVGNESIATTGSIVAGSMQLTVASIGGSTTGFSVGNYLTVVGAGARAVPGNIVAGSNQLTLLSAAGFTLDTYVRVDGAGAAGVLLFAQIRNIVGNVLTLSENAATTVTGANVTNDGVLYDARIVALAGNYLTLDRAAYATVTNARVQIDDHPAFVACLEDMRSQVNPASYGALWSGAKVVVPPGVKDPSQSTGGSYHLGHFGYRLSRPLHITSSCLFEGTGGYDFPSTVLHFDAGVTGIIFDSTEDRGLPHQHARADGTIFRHIALMGSTAEGPVDSLAGGNYSLPWQPGVAVSAGSVRVPSTYQPNLFGKAILCVVGGTTAMGYKNEPNWNTVGNDSGIYTESTGVVWKMIDCDGVYMEAPCKIENCFVRGFSGNGINYQALGAGIAIANNSKIEGNRVTLCGGNGIRAHGNDANQAHIEANDVTQCYGYGYVDTTLLSCIWVSNHGAECLRGPAWFDHGRVFGHYAEGSQGPIHIGQQAAWVHGIAGSGSGDAFDNVSKAQRGKTWSASTSFSPGSVVYPTIDNGYYYWSYGGSSGSTEPDWPLGRGKTVQDGAITWYCYGPSAVQQNLSILHQNTMTPTRFSNTAGAYKTQFAASSANSDEFCGWQSGIDDATMATGYSVMGPDVHGIGWQALEWARDWTKQALCLSTPRAVAAGTANAPGMLEIPYPFYLGSPYYSRILQHVGTTAPTSGAWLLGSFVWNAAPTVNGLLGWQCVASGTPGTWVPVAITGGRVRHSMTSDADYTLTPEEQCSAVVEVTDTGSVLTATRNVVLPAFDGRVWVAYNGTGQSLVCKTASGAGIMLLPGERKQVYCDGTNIVPGC